MQYLKRKSLNIILSILSLTGLILIFLYVPPTETYILFIVPVLLFIFVTSIFNLFLSLKISLFIAFICTSFLILELLQILDIVNAAILLVFAVLVGFLLRQKH